ncbi:MAG TPA: LLM class flavin-dependent oxidoreductase [Pseudonocardia sp.]|nr:LLM class flavin-dependent oxidoreductase [Pseudonocardia sp.]
MDIGVLLGFTNSHDNMSDADMFRQETELGVLAEQYGFDSVWAPEHHFDDYSMCPDNVQLTTYLAAKTSRIKLGTGAVILPWNDPLRVVEKITMLDILSEGRVLFGMGRGLAQMEYEGFREDMDASRDKFDEAARMIIRGLENGYVENDGPIYVQPRVDVRPAPEAGREWADRIYGVAMSPDSVVSVAKIGARMMTFTQYPAEKIAPSVEQYREIFRETHHREPGPIMTLDFGYCHEDAEEAARVARECCGQYFLSVIKHYDLAGSHWRKTKGYEAYQEGAEMIREAGMEGAVAGYVNTQIWGTPDQIVEKYRHRLDVLGDQEVAIAPSFGGLPFDKSRASLKLLGEKVVPELRKMGVKTAATV